MCRGFLCHFGNPKYTGDITLCEINNYMRQAQSSITIRRRPKGISKTEVYYLASNANTLTDIDSLYNKTVNQIPLANWSKTTGFTGLTTARPNLWRMDLTTYTDNTTTASYNMYNSLTALSAEAVPDCSVISVNLRPNKVINESAEKDVQIKLYFNGDEITPVSISAAYIGEKTDSQAPVTTYINSGKAYLNLETYASGVIARNGSEVYTDASYKVTVYGQDGAGNTKKGECVVQIMGVVSDVWEPINVSSLFNAQSTSNATLSKGKLDGLYPNGAELYAVDKHGTKIPVEWGYSSLLSSAMNQDSFTGFLLIKTFETYPAYKVNYMFIVVKAENTATQRLSNSAKGICFSGSSEEYNDLVNTLFI